VKSSIACSGALSDWSIDSVSATTGWAQGTLIVHAQAELIAYDTSTSMMEDKY
jgi:hypothetical protein